MAKRFPWYPIFIDVEDHEVVIIGGGEVCARKAETMMRYGARVTIVSPKFTPEIEGWAKDGKLTLRRKRYEPGDLDGANIVIASTDDTAVNEQIAADCRRRRIPVNVVDVTPLCEFIVPAIIDKGSVTLAVSTGGKSPALAQHRPVVTLPPDARHCCPAVLVGVGVGADTAVGVTDGTAVAVAGAGSPSSEPHPFRSNTLRITTPARSGMRFTVRPPSGGRYT